LGATIARQKKYCQDKKKRQKWLILSSFTSQSFETFSLLIGLLNTQCTLTRNVDFILCVPIYRHPKNRIIKYVDCLFWALLILLVYIHVDIYSSGSQIKVKQTLTSSWWEFYLSFQYSIIEWNNLLECIEIFESINWLFINNVQ
jgi:hypothetical protein